MSRYKVTVTQVEPVTHNVVRIRTERPPELEFVSGQATEIFLDKVGWENEGRPFTFTGLPENDYLEFTIKCYEERKGVTNEIKKLKPSDHLILNDIFGAIAFKGEGVFIAGGAGVTPFISIIRHLEQRNEIGNSQLIFANKTRADIILKEEFERVLGRNFINILSDENAPGYAHGYITEDFLRENVAALDKYFYLCGPPPMMEAVEAILDGLEIGPERIVKEES